MCTEFSSVADHVAVLFDRDISKISRYDVQPPKKMLSIENKLDDMAETAAFEAGGYPALWKYKAWKMYEAVSSGECCK
jgi:hypothetical protein